MKHVFFQQYKEIWFVEIWNKPKLRNLYAEEDYVGQNISKIKTSLCAQLHSGTLLLAAETGRFR